MDHLDHFDRELAELKAERNRLLRLKRDLMEKGVDEAEVVGENPVPDNPPVSKPKHDGPTCPICLSQIPSYLLLYGNVPKTCDNRACRTQWRRIHCKRSVKSNRLLVTVDVSSAPVVADEPKVVTTHCTQCGDKLLGFQVRLGRTLCGRCVT